MFLLSFAAVCHQQQLVAVDDGFRNFNDSCNLGNFTSRCNKLQKSVGQGFTFFYLWLTLNNYENSLAFDCQFWRRFLYLAMNFLLYSDNRLGFFSLNYVYGAHRRSSSRVLTSESSRWYWGWRIRLPLSSNFYLYLPMAPAGNCVQLYGRSHNHPRWGLW